ncbi:hypothetical protein DY000_02049282 [Brassica cretica]|uniref:BED-type domain-containing protein n=1 Tax=Brassica cretica TaxID=69181 RepID=A0ABQ7ET99_BRACR|nr:hypothetical protein DY000_02049282 [Brassica cretica]
MDSDLEPVALTPQKQDSAWKHCEVYKYGDRVQMRCLYCKKMFKGGGITRVKEHLAGKKGQGTICDQVPEEVRLFLQQCIDGTVRRQRKRRRSSAEPLPIAYFPPEETQVVEGSYVNNGDVVAAAGGQSSGRTKQRTYRSRKNIVERSELANVEDLIGGDMDNLIPVAISSVKNIVHPSSKEREKTVHMAIGRFLFDIGADFDAVSSVNFQPLVDAIVSGGFGVSLPANEDIKSWILKSCVEEKFTFGNDILQPAFTTYSTNFATMSRIAELKPHLQAMVTSSEWNECSYSKEAGGLAMTETINDEKKLVPEDNIQDIIGKDINSYKNAVGIFGRNLAIRARDTMLPAEWWSTYGESCLNLSRFAIRLLSQTCSSLVGSGRILAPMEKQQRLPLHAAGFYLNPKFFYNIGEEMRSEIHLAVVDCIEKLVPEDNIQDIIGKDINSYKNAVGIFGRNLAIRARDTMLPAEWWSTYGESCLNLSRFAIRLLSQTCSSLVGSGRILAPMEKSNMELLEDWVSRNQVCIEGNGSSDWKSLESFKRTEVAAAVIDETGDLGTGFDDGEIFKGEKEVSDEGYFTNISEKLFT